MLLFSLAGLLVPSSAAAAGSPITRFAAGPIAPTTHCNPNLTPDQMVTTAGARTDFCVAFYVDGGAPRAGDDLAATQVDTPQGFLAQADTAPSCTNAQFNKDRGEPATCPKDSQIGAGEAVVRVDLNGLIIPRIIKAKVWSLEHTPNEVSKLGIELETELGGIPLPHSKLVGRVTLRPNPDVGLRTIITDQPRTADLGSLLGRHPIAIDGFFLRFWGSQADHPSMPQNFALLGSDCTTDQRARIIGTSTDGSTSTNEDSYRLTDCENVPFGSSTTVTTAERRPDVPTATEVKYRIEQNFFPRVTSNVKRQVITLPAGLELGAQLASSDNGLPLCSAEQFGWDRVGPSSCPAGAKVADVEIVSPLQKNVFTGAAYVGPQLNGDGLPQLYIEAGFGDMIDSPRVKLRGTMRINEQNQIETTLDNLPQVLFEEFRLKFRGGDHAPLSTPRACGTTTGMSQSTPSSTGVPIEQELSLTIDEDCIDPAAFTPSMSITTSNPQAGARTVTSVATSRPDRQARITGITADLPPGVLSDLNLATECTTEQAAAQSCPESSRIGTVVAKSGVGPKPKAVTGKVFLATRAEGAVAGVVIATPVAFGDVNLGMLNVPARIELRPGDLGLRFISQIPTRYKGLSLNLRSFDVALDRPDFAINPTNCSPLNTTSTLTSEAGGTASVPIGFQVSGCESLGFDPSMAMSLVGKTGQGDKPALGVTVSLAKGGSNIKSTRVTLPPGLGADLKQVPRACPLPAWDAGQCTPDAIIGAAQANLAITTEDIPGTVSMVSIPGKTLPGVGIQLQGRFAARILGSIGIDQKTGQLTTEFPSLPDVPISTLRLSFEGGPRGALISTRALCAAPQIIMKGAFVGQSGATAAREARASCQATQAAGVLLARVTGTSRGKVTIRLSAPTGKKIKTVRLGLASTVGLSAKKLTATKTVRGAKTLKARGKRTLDVTVGKGGRATVTITLPKGLLALSAKAKKKTFAINARVAYTDGKRDVKKLTVKR